MKKIFRIFLVITVLMGAFAMITNTGEVQAARIPTEEEENAPKTRIGDGNACDNVLDNGSTAVFGANKWNGYAFYHTFANRSTRSGYVYNSVLSPSYYFRSSDWTSPYNPIQLHSGNEFSVNAIFLIKAYDRNTNQVLVSHYQQVGGATTITQDFWAYPTYMIETIPNQGTKTCVSTYQ